MLTQIFSIILASILPIAAYAFDTKAQYAIMVDYDTDQVIFDKHSDVATAPSSMSKLMTLYMVFDKLKQKEISLSDELLVSEKAWRKAGSKMFLQIGSKVTIEDLIRGIAVQSGNDACIVIAEGLAGTEEAFAENMNVKAAEIGLRDSSFKNSTGWPDPGHLMSARDLALLAKRLIHDFPEYYNYFSEREFVHNGITQQNRNMLLDMNIGVDGLKTGHTDIAGYGITTSAKQKDRRLILVVNGLRGTVERARESARILQHGFLNYTNAVIAKKGAIIEEANLWMSKNKTIGLAVAEDIVMTIPKDQLKKITAEIHYKSPITVPVKAGEKLGELHVKFADELKTYPLIAITDANKLPYLSRLSRNLDYYLFGK